MIEYHQKYHTLERSFNVPVFLSNFVMEFLIFLKINLLNFLVNILANQTYGAMSPIIYFKCCFTIQQHTEKKVQRISIQYTKIIVCVPNHYFRKH